MHTTLTIETRGRGLHEITPNVRKAVGALLGRDTSASASGLCTVFIGHTSASLTIQENADPSARADLESWLERLVPDGDPRYTHTGEGPDDMPSHIKSALTSVSISIPIIEGALALGRWQGIYVWERRQLAYEREVGVHIARAMRWGR
jgi:secondary thiamine-phosphate synthase enzyme